MAVITSSSGQSRASASAFASGRVSGSVRWWSMPESAASVKIEGVRKIGPRASCSAGKTRGLEQTRLRPRSSSKSRDSRLIPPYDHPPNVIRGGQGTVGLEDSRRLAPKSPPIMVPVGWRRIAWPAICSGRFAGPLRPDVKRDCGGACQHPPKPVRGRFGRRRARQPSAAGSKPRRWALLGRTGRPAHGGH